MIKVGSWNRVLVFSRHFEITMLDCSVCMEVRVHKILVLNKIIVIVKIAALTLGMTYGHEF